MISRREFLVAGTAFVGGARLVAAGNPAASAESPSPGSSPAAEEAATYNPENVKAWFDKTYFNMIVDYYSAVLQRPYGSGITHENVLRVAQDCPAGLYPLSRQGAQRRHGVSAAGWARNTQSSAATR